MFWLNPDFWNEATKIAPYALILLGALSGGASSFVNNNEPFKLGTYIFEVMSSLVAGSIVLLVLRTTNTPEGLIFALAALAAYFGTKMLSIFYQIFIVRIKKASGINEKDKEE